MGVAMENQTVSQPTDSAASRAARLYYLDWLRVIATLGVFLFHVSNVFSGANYEITNAESSDNLFIFTSFFFPWGMPLFFLVSGAGSWFALRRRSAGQFTRERTLRILVPFCTGSLFLGPVQIYLSWRHKSEVGVFDGSLLDFAAERMPAIGPKLFGAVGYHMWFLGFLFAFSLLALPLFMWLKGKSGRRFVLRLASLCATRGGILLFILPLVVLRLVLQPFFSELQDWADFFSFGAFFVLGFLLFCNEQFVQAIRRDWWILLGVGIASTVAATAIGMSLEPFDIEAAPRSVWEFLMWGCVAICSWTWTAFTLFIGMRYLDRDSRARRYGQVTLLPFFVAHQPVILAVAYFVVQWEASISIKFLAVSFGAFLLTLGLCELLIKRIGFLRTLFGMKAEQPARVQMATA